MSPYVFLCLLSMVNLAQADVLTGLYAAKVPVSSQSGKAQEQAIQLAFKEVLVKVSGSRELLEDNVIRTRVRNARQYLRQYQFENVQSDSPSNDNSQQQLYFLANFDSVKVDGLLLDAGFPIWGSHRPSTILWLAEENESLERQLYSEYTDTNLKHHFLDGARRRGLSLVFPVLDITDLSNAGLYDVWGRFTDNIINASQRYDLEIVMSARVYPQQDLATDFENESNSLTDNAADELTEQSNETLVNTSPEAELIDENRGWQVDWFIFMDGEMQTGTVLGEDRSYISNVLVDLLADKLAAKYAVRASVGLNGLGAQSEITLMNISSVDAYVHAKRYFESLQAVTVVQLTSLKEQRAVFNVSLVGRIDDLINTLLLDDKVRRVTDAFGRPTGELEFVWNP